MNSPRPTQIRLDLDRLVESYMDNLNINLRGFKAAEEFEFLETWVPDDDPARNLLELLELGREAGLAEVIVTVNAATLVRLDLTELRKFTGPFETRARGEQTDLVFSIVAFSRQPRAVRSVGGSAVANADLPQTGKEEPAAAAANFAPDAAPKSTSQLDVFPAYRQGLAAMLESVTHEQPLAKIDGRTLVRGTYEGITLEALVDPARHIVQQAAFGGARNPEARAVSEALCRAMEQRPIQECAEHAVIGVERGVRDAKLPAPVPGLVTPDNADPVFVLAQRLVRELLRVYCAETGYRETANFYDRPVTKEWIKRSEAERLELVRAALVSEPGGEQLEVVGMDGLKRAVVQFRGELTSDAKQELLARLDAHVRRNVEPALQLVAQIKADKNVLRLPDKRK